MPGSRQIFTTLPNRCILHACIVPVMHVMHACNVHFTKIETASGPNQDAISEPGQPLPLQKNKCSVFCCFHKAINWVTTV